MKISTTAPLALFFIVGCTAPAVDDDVTGEDFAICAGLDAFELEGVTSAPAGVDGRVSGIDLLRGINGDGVYRLHFTDAGGAEHLLRFAPDDDEIDGPRGAVHATFGALPASQPTRSGWVRLADDEGVWFAGGTILVADGEPYGGALVDAPLALGAVTKTCAPDADDNDLDDGGTVHDVRVAFDDDGDIEVAVGTVTTGVLEAHPVSVVIGRATTTRSTIEDATHVEVQIDAYLYRRKPAVDGIGTCAGQPSVRLGVGTTWAYAGGGDMAVDIEVEVVDDVARFVFSGASSSDFDSDWAVPLHGYDIDTPVPPVRALLGPMTVGEGDGVGFVRFVDARGLWFEGGYAAHSTTMYQGGGLPGGAFSLVLEERCGAAAALDDDRCCMDAAIGVAFDDGTVELDPGATATGIRSGVDVAVIAGNASHTEWYAYEAAEDLHGIGPMHSSGWSGVLFRRAPSPLDP